jgi:hypothetical protein
MDGLGMCGLSGCEEQGKERMEEWGGREGSDA